MKFSISQIVFTEREKDDPQRTDLRASMSRSDLRSDQRASISRTRSGSWRNLLALQQSMRALELILLDLKLKKNIIKNIHIF